MFKKQVGLLLATPSFAFAYYFFYLKYVPLVEGFQWILITLLGLTVLLTSYSLRQGILLFVFLFPLINSLPYFFRIDQNVPHAPTALVLFLAFFLGWLIHYLTHPGMAVRFRFPIVPLSLLFFLILVSSLITAFRFMNFFPVLSQGIREVIVNVNEVRAGGGVMSVLFSGLNYLSAFSFFAIVFQAIDSDSYLKKILTVLLVSISISLFFSLWQIFYSVGLGNTSFWIKLNQINSTFKDPNSFGCFLSATFALLLGVFFSIKGSWRIYVAAAGVMLLFVFPFVGSRSGFLGLVGSCFAFMVFMITRGKYYARKKIVFLFALVSLLIMTLSLPLYISKDVTVYKRFKENIELYMRKGIDIHGWGPILTGKAVLWATGARMGFDYPLTGVGVGAFIIELPDYLKRESLFHINTDSAENYFIQFGAELGLIGLCLVFWVFWEIFRKMKGALRNTFGDSNEYLVFGIISATLAIFINFFFHSYIGSFEVKFLFWLLVALILVLSKEKETPVEAPQFNTKFKVLTLTVVFFYGGVHLYNSVRGLSITAFAKEFDIKQNFGLYQKEVDNRGFPFQWAKKTAGISLGRLGSSLVIPVGASHPDLEQNPVKVNIFLADRYFNRKALLKKVVFHKKKWEDVVCEIPELDTNTVNLVFETGRTWRPSEHGISHDLRELAIELGRPWFRYPADVLDDRIQKVEVFSSLLWQGKYGRSLHSNGISHLRFYADSKDFWIRLHARGQKALGLGPYISIRLDDRLIGETMLTEENWVSIILKPLVSEGNHSLSVEFINDFNDKKTKQDRNVFLGDLDIIYFQGHLEHK
jgi:hypothetical protein